MLFLGRPIELATTGKESSKDGLLGMVPQVGIKHGISDDIVIIISYLSIKYTTQLSFSLSLFPIDSSLSRLLMACLSE